MMKPFEHLPPYALVPHSFPALAGTFKVRVDILAGAPPALRSYTLVEAGYGEKARMARVRLEMDAWARRAMKLPRPIDQVTLAHLIRLGYEKPGAINMGRPAAMGVPTIATESRP
jgi:hypothetical protein